MKIEDVPFAVTDWNNISPIQHAGKTGQAIWQTLETGNIVLVLTGELLTELKDGRKFTLRPGMSYQVGSDAEPHKSSAPTGATLFIVD